MTTVIDTIELETKVKRMYREVAQHPHGTYHFETGRRLADQLGYHSGLLDRVPPAAVDSFAGVGYFFDDAALQPGEKVFDLGSGSGMDAFIAGTLVGPTGLVVGVDFTPQQLDQARRLATESGVDGYVQFRDGRIESLFAPTGAVDCVISNGVINLCPEKERVFAEAARILRPGGRLAIADIVTERPLTEAIVCNVDLWASCIGGASQEDDYRAAIEAVGLRVERVRTNSYEFLSPSARSATHTYGVKSISVLATKPSD